MKMARFVCKSSHFLSNDFNTEQNHFYVTSFALLLGQVQVQMNLKNQINLENVPKHVAIIMDGNGRWAKAKGMPRMYGHRSGVKSVRDVTEAAAEIGINYLTLYAFSTENWSRPPAEVTALMTLLVETIKKEIADLHKNGVRLHAIGAIEQLPEATYKALLDGIEKTKHNQRINLVLALNYSAKWEILQATKSIAHLVKGGLLDPDQITEIDFERALSTQGIPDPELLIRTSGETRISNFLLWQIAYSELYFTPIMWPDFGREELFKAILNYQQRERRFGQTSEQLI
jgi:undecaprenyl diphosphate synthase